MATIGRYRFSNRISTLYLVILIGNMFTNRVRSKPLISGVNTNSLSKFETDFGKDYFTSYKNHSTLNKLPFTPPSSFHPPDMPQQEALSRMKITGQPTTHLAQSSKNSYHENKTPVGVMDTVEQIYSIHHTTTKVTEDLNHGGTDSFSGVYTKTVHSPFRSEVNEYSKVPISQLKTMPHSQNSLILSFESHETMDVHKSSIPDVISESEVRGFSGYSDSDYSRSTLSVDLSVSSVTLYSSSLLSLIHSDHDELYHSLTKVWLHPNTNKRQLLEDFTNQTSTIEPPDTPSVFKLRPSLTSDWEQEVPPLDSYSTLPLHTIWDSFRDSAAETKGHLSTTRIFSTLLLFEKEHYREFLNTDKISSIESQYGLPSRSEQPFPFIQSSMTNMFASQIDVHDSGVDILPSTYHGSSSDLRIDGVTTPTLSSNRLTISILIEPDDSFKDSYKHIDKTKEIMASKTIIEKTQLESIDNSKQSSKPLVSSPLIHKGYSSQLISSIHVLPHYAEKWTATLPTVTAKTEMKNINVSDLQSVLMTTSFPGSSTLSSMPISVQLDIVSSSSESNQILEINNDLTDRPQIVTDLSNRLLTSHNTEYSNGQISVYHSTVLTESTKYYQISSEDTLMISTVYPLRNHVSITDTGLNGTKETTHDEQTLASVYSLEKTMLSTVYQSESSFIPSVTSFIDLAPSSSFETIRQYSTLDNAYHSMNYIHDDSEPGHHAGTEETTDVKDIVVKTNEKEIKIEININNNIVQEERKSTTITTTTTTQQPPQMPLELIVICAYMCQQRGSPIPPFCGCTLQAWLR